MAQHQEWVYIPDYLGIPAVFNTKRGVLWQVVTMPTNEELTDWYNNAHEQMIANGVPTVNTHKKYPILLFPVIIYKEISSEKLEKVGNKACDYYANIWLNEKR